MKTGKLIMLLLLVSTLLLVSSGTLNCVTKQDYISPPKSAGDSTQIDTFQNLLNDYCKSKSAKDTIENRLTRLKKQKEYGEKLLEQKKYEKNQREIIYRSKGDSVLFANDSSRKQKNDRGKLKNDSLANKINKEISVIKKQNKDFQLEIDSLQNELAKRKISHDNCLKKINKYTSRIHGGLHFNFCGIPYNVFVAHLDSEDIRIHLFKNEKQNYLSINAVLEYLQGKKIDPLMITNAGMFTPNREPVGLYIEDGSKTQYKLDTSKRNTDENFYLSPNGVFFIDSNNIPSIETTENFLKLQKEIINKIKLATQSGPMLLVNGAIHPKFTWGSANAKIRSGVGKMNDKKLVFAITMNESNFYEFALLFKDIFNCKDALFLDGAISQMYLKNINTQVSNYNYGPMISVLKNTDVKKIIATFIFCISMVLLRAQVETYSNYSFNGDSYNALIIKIDSEMISKFEILQNNAGLHHQAFLSKLLKNDSSFMLINACINDTACKPVGFYVKNSKQIRPVNLKNGTGNFYLKPNGAFLLTQNDAIVCESSKIKNYHDIRLGIQSGPLLLNNGAINQQFNPNSTNKKVRCGVGLFVDGKNEKFLVFSISNNPVSFYNFAIFFQKKFKCNNALCLESEGCSMYFPDQDALANKKFDGHICNYIYLKL